MAENTNQAINRNEALVTELLKIIDNIPNFVPFQRGIQEHLNKLLSALQGLRSPRII